MIGFDTGFFIRLWNKNKQAVEVWRKIENGEIEGAISVITLYELRRLNLKGTIKIDFEKVREIALNLLTVVQITPEIADKSALLSYGIGLHMADALILTPLLEIECKEIYTDNISHLGKYRKRGINIIQIE